MAQSYRSRYLAVHRSNEQAMKSLYSALARDIAAEVTKRADRDGNVPRSAAFELQRAIADRVQAMFLGRDRDGKLAPFTLFPGGALVPLSPYMRQLWDSIKAAIRIPVEQNAVILANKLPADVLYVMARATRNPFVAAGRVAELFRPDPLAVYAATHEWVDPNGYRLSDRVWNVAAETRRQIDAYVEDSLRRGIGALEMSRGLRQFLTPGEQLRTTNKPYGRTASYSGMRLARTEITRAHNQAHRLAASMNPFVNGLKWNLSARHPKYDICDEYARGGPGGDGVYSVEAYPEIPHSQCLCFPSNVMIPAAESASIIDQLRADIQSARAEFVDLVGPLRVEAFEKLLFGEGLEVVSIPGQASRFIKPAITPPVAPPPAPTPVIEPTAPASVVEPVQPTGDIALITSAQDGAARRVIDLARETITRVHQVPANLPVVPVFVEDAGAVNGSYFVEWDKVRPGRILINESLQRKEFTFLHEFGHYLDHQHLAISEDWRDIAQNNTIRPVAGVSEKLRVELWRTVRKTRLVNDMEARRDALAAARPLLADGGEKTPDERFLDYQLQEAEIWARAYAQWVSTRSLRNMGDVMSRSGHWENSDFAPVGKVIDRIFKSLGLL